jgi:hypothetical protein
MRQLSHLNYTFSLIEIGLVYKLIYIWCSSMLMQIYYLEKRSNQLQCRTMVRGCCQNCDGCIVPFHMVKSVRNKDFHMSDIGLFW